MSDIKQRVRVPIELGLHSTIAKLRSQDPEKLDYKAYYASLVNEQAREVRAIYLKALKDKKNGLEESENISALFAVLDLSVEAKDNRKAAGFHSKEISLFMTDSEWKEFTNLVESICKEFGHEKKYRFIAKKDFAIMLLKRAVRDDRQADIYTTPVERAVVSAIQAESEEDLSKIRGRFLEEIEGFVYDPEKALEQIKNVLGVLLDDTMDKKRAWKAENTPAGRLKALSEEKIKEFESKASAFVKAQSNE